MQEAKFYDSSSGGTVVCRLCPHRCRIKEGKRGACGVRENQGGRLFSLVHSRVIAANVDPIEKKPLFHFHPGTLSFSVATVGCNMHCLHCQNAEISQMPFDRRKIEGRILSPEEAVSAALAGPRQLTYQGSLVGADSQPVSDGTYDMRFRIYDDPLAGALR
ncbi:MAG: hypothetical protein ACWGSD_02860, partial [Thermodesulfobacteriota bacterium]